MKRVPNKKEQHENRRVRITKQMMKDALLELLEQQKLVSISVTAICEAADVHRSTFYNYYTDPEDLLKDIEQDFLDRIPTKPKEFDQHDLEQIFNSTAAYCDDVMKNKKAYQILFSESAGNGFASTLVEYFSLGHDPVDKQNDEVTDRFVRLYIANGTVGMLREWVEKDCPVSSRKMAEMMYYFSQKVAV